MMANSLQDQARVALASIGEAGLLAVRYALTSPLSRWITGPSPAHHLLLVPQDLRTADPSFATELYEGYFGLAGAVALTGSESPFAVRPPSAAWERELYSFSWVRNLHAADDDIAREKARVLMADWLLKTRSAPQISRQLGVTARRVISLLSHAGFLLDGVDSRLYDAFMRSLTEDLHILNVGQSGAEHTLDKLTALAALTLAGLCVSEQQASLASYSANFQAELDKQILPDGGHISRNPHCLIELMLDILPLKQCFIARQMEPPEFLLNAIRRIFPMLRFMRMGDGSLGRFNGMGPTPVDFLATVLVYDDDPQPMASRMDASGYVRMARGGTLLLADIGPPPPLRSSRCAHAGCLSFELTSGFFPVIVNCGAPPDEASDWSVVCRSTAAHSTLTINDVSSSRIIKAQGLRAKPDDHFLIGPKSVKAEVIDEADGGISMRAAHDGFQDRFHVTHRRKLRLNADGTLLHGVDQLAARAGKTPFAEGRDVYAVRFHLHPDVAAVRANDAHTVALVLPSEEIWYLRAEGQRVEIEESIFLADPVGPRRSLQIVMSGRCSQDTQIVWTLRKAEARQQRTQPRMPSETNPALAGTIEHDGNESGEP